MPFDPARRIHRLRLSVLSSEQMRAVSSGEITSPDTINHKTLLPEPGGLFCQRIFGPLTDLTCACGRRRTDESEPVLCQRCGVERIESAARRTRFGHIPLAAPICHIWRYRGSGNQITLLTGIPPKDLDKIVHHAADVVVQADLRATEQIARNFTDKGEREIARLIQRTRVGDAMTPQAARALETTAQGAVQTETGAAAIRRILSDLDIEAQLHRTHEQLDEKDGPQREKAIRKIRLIEDIMSSDADITDMVTDTVLVLPPSLRPMMQMESGRFASSDLNDLYRKVINRNNRLRRFLAMNTPDVILRNERRLLQNAVDTLFDNSGAAQPALGLSDRPLRSVSDQLRGKKGRFRQNLLGKRVDYSGRSVIVSGPDLNLGQCGLPYDMAAELFRPHLIRRLIARTPLSSKHSAMALSKKTHLPIVREALDELAAERLIILNRAPTLHRLSMQAFHPVLSDDKVIRLHPLSCGGFNADFDGDQMAVHAPLSREALEEAKERMRGSLNTVSPADGSPSALPSLDIILGLYYLTILDPQAAPGPGRVHHFSDPETAERAHAAGALALRAPITAGGIKGTTSPGRIIFNRALPNDTPFQNTDADKKLIGRIVLDMYESDHYGPAHIARTLDALKNLGFRYAFLSGLSIGVSDMITPPGKPGAVAHAEGQAAEIAEAHLSGLIDDEERHEHIIRIWQQTSDEVKSMVEEIFPELGDLHLMATSGAKGNIDNIRQMVGMRGLMSDPSGRTIERPVKSHFAEGLGLFEYFISTHGARKGLADTALRTSDAGYLTRRLVDATHHIFVSTEDCGTDEGLMRTPREEDFADGVARRLLARDVSLSDGTALRRGTRISPALAKRLTEDPAVSYLTVRTPLRCRAAVGICAACYGDSLTDLLPAKAGLAAGVIAAQSIGEPGTQLTMRTFHRGGVAGDDITNGLPRVEEILEARKPALLAAICRETGTVSSVSQSEMTVQSLKDGGIQSYGKRWPNSRFLHAPGDYVEAGSVLTTGSGHLPEILEVGGPEMAWKYAISEVQSVYRSQGVDIHDKHIEIILSAMFAFCATTDPGDTGLLEGETVRRTRLTALNEEAERSGQRPAHALPMVMGITRSAILAEGFLSSASFQRTTQALADASLARAEDRLSGLKENVIVGQLIPTATLPAPH